MRVIACIFTLVLLLPVCAAISRTEHLRQHLRKTSHALVGEDELLGMDHDSLVRMVLEQQGQTAIKTANPDEIYWWEYKNTDCGYDDVPGSCQGDTVDACKAKCIATSGCGGFNYPHGVFKKTDCTSHMAASTVDLYVVKNTPQPPPPPPAVNFPPIWPMPLSAKNGSTVVSVDAKNWKFESGQQSADLTAAFARYQDIMLSHPVTGSPSGSNVISSVMVTVADTSGTLQLETDESYQLVVPTSGVVTITAQTVFGAFHGLETLSQLVAFNFDTKTYEIAAAPWNITDKPRFPHREVLLDSSRHFLPVATLKSMIRSLPFSKINVVHWHIVDQQAFPFDSPSNPKLASAGAYSMQERFTVEDVAEVVEFARQHGVRVMVEIDTPGHASSWCSGYPEVCPSPTCTEPLNPATNATFELIERLFMDLTSGKRGSGLFPDNMMHLGGDEVNTKCWESTPAVAQWLTANNLTADQGYMYFVKRVQAIAHAQGRDAVGWEEIWDHFGTKLDKSTIIHQWLPHSTIAKEATAAGYRVLWSTDGDWYLDGLGTKWQDMYIQEPCDGIPDNLCETLMLGGGGEMWGETVDTSDQQQTVWPRLAAIGERLWSPRSVNDTDAAHARYVAFRCLLNRRGVMAAPANNPSARTSPPGPGSCYAQ